MQMDEPLNIELKVQEIYRSLDRDIGLFQLATGLRCPRGCGICCKSPEVEATVLEVIPLAFQIQREKREEAVLISIEEELSRGDLTCVLVRPGEDRAGEGRCSYYGLRPLLCRLFGFSLRYNKYGRPELCPCRVIKETAPNKVQEACKAIQNGLQGPVYQTSFLSIASLNPGIGYRLIPINQAIKEALEYLYWKKRFTPQPEGPLMAHVA
jgi:Fe-S-cluster containining protein